MANIHQNSVRAGLSNIFNSGQYSDVTICSGGREFKVHRAVICQRSHFFAAACDGNFKEATTKRILLDDDNPNTIERMLLYLYTWDYDDGSSSGLAKKVGMVGSGTNEASPESIDESVPADTVGVSEGGSKTGESALLNNVLVYAIADKYGILELKELANNKFLSQADSLMSSDDFPNIIKMVYKSTPNSDRGLRNVVLNICVKQLRALLDNVAFNNVVRSIGDFGCDILCETLKFNDERLDELLAQKAAVEEEVKKVRDEMIDAERKMSQTKDFLQNIVRVINRHLP